MAGRAFAFSDPGHYTVAVHVQEDRIAFEDRAGEDAVTVVLRRGDRIDWYCDAGNCSILFPGDDPPFRKPGYSALRGERTQAAEAIGKPGTYRYEVTVALENGFRTGLAELILENGPF